MGQNDPKADVAEPVERGERETDHRRSLRGYRAYGMYNDWELWWLLH